MTHENTEPEPTPRRDSASSRSVGCWDDATITHRGKGISPHFLCSQESTLQHSIHTFLVRHNWRGVEIDDLYQSFIVHMLTPIDYYWSCGSGSWPRIKNYKPERSKPETFLQTYLNTWLRGEYSRVLKRRRIQVQRTNDATISPSVANMLSREEFDEITGRILRGASRTEVQSWNELLHALAYSEFNRRRCAALMMTRPDTLNRRLSRFREAVAKLS